MSVNRQFVRPDVIYTVSNPYKPSAFDTIHLEYPPLSVNRQFVQPDVRVVQSLHDAVEIIWSL